MRRPGPGARRLLAPGTARHGPDRRRAPPALPPSAWLPHVSSRVPGTANDLAGGPEPARRHQRSVPRLRLSAVRPPDHAGGAGHPRPEPLDHGRQRRRARARRHHRALQRGLRWRWLPTRDLLPGVWAGGEHPAGLLQPEERPAAPSGGGRRRAGPRRPAARRREPRTVEDARLVRDAGRRAGARDRRPHDLAGPACGRGGRDLGQGTQRGRRLLGTGAGERADLRGVPHGRSRTLAPYRRPRRPRGRGALRHREDQGPDHPPGPQALPPGHRAHGRGRPRPCTPGGRGPAVAWNARPGAVEGVGLVCEVEDCDEPTRREVERAIRAAVSKDHEAPIARLLFLPARKLPKTTSGKTQRHACAALLRADRPAEVTAP